MKKLNPIEVCLQACENWGLIPTSFRQCMTWEEQVLWLSKFLEKTVIPALNDDIAAITELQGLFIELKDYVDNYFKNLDVQDEINNKLDEMAESGQLADLIAAYLQLKGVLAFDTVADIEDATNLVNGSFVKTYGYLRTGDGVYDIYKVRKLVNTDVIDGYNLVAITAAPTLVAERLDYGKELVINLKSTDNLQSYLSLNGKKTIVLPKNGTLVMTEPLFLTSDTEIDMNGCTVNFDYDRPTTTFPLVDWDETMGFMSYKADSTYTGYDGLKNITIKNGTIIKGSSNFMHSVNVTFDNVEFLELGNRHAMQFAACDGVIVKNCTFNGVRNDAGNESASGCINIDCCNYGAQPYVANTSPMYDHTSNKNIVIASNTFKDGTGANYVYQIAIDAHGGDTYGDTEYTSCENLVIENNNFGSPRNCGINIRDFVNVTISNNMMRCDAAYPVPFIRRYGFATGLIVNNNIIENCTNVIRANTPCLPLNDFNVSSNKVVALDAKSDSDGVFQLFNAKKGKISNNSFTYQHHIVHLNSRDYFDGTSIGADGYCVDIEFSNNDCEKTLNSATYFGAFRIASSTNIKISNNTFNHDGTLQADYVELLEQSNVTNLRFINNVTDAPYQLLAPEKVTTLCNGNNGKYVLMTEGPSYDATSGSGTLRNSIMNFSGLLLQLGHTNNMESVVLRPWLPSGYADKNKFDSSSRAWKIPVSLDNGNYGVVTITIQGASYSWTGNIAIRKIYGLD